MSEVKQNVVIKTALDIGNTNTCVAVQYEYTTRVVTKKDGSTSGGNQAIKTVKAKLPSGYVTVPPAKSDREVYEVRFDGVDHYLGLGALNGRTFQRRMNKDKWDAEYIGTMTVAVLKVLVDKDKYIRDLLADDTISVRFDICAGHPMHLSDEGELNQLREVYQEAYSLKRGKFHMQLVSLLAEGRYVYKNYERKPGEYLLSFDIGYGSTDTVIVRPTGKIVTKGYESGGVGFSQEADADIGDAEAVETEIHLTGSADPIVVERSVLFMSKFRNVVKAKSGVHLLVSGGAAKILDEKQKARLNRVYDTVQFGGEFDNVLAFLDECL